MLKSLLRIAIPRVYQNLWELKERLRRGFSDRRWEHYFQPDYNKRPWLAEPIPELVKLKLPAYVDTVLDVGCASGRNFIPFDGKLKLWGIDLVAKRGIRWVRKFRNLTYEQISIEKLTDRFEKARPDLSKVFVFSSGALIYVPPTSDGFLTFV